MINSVAGPIRYVDPTKWDKDTGKANRTKIESKFKSQFLFGKKYKKINFGEIPVYVESVHSTE